MKLINDYYEKKEISEFVSTSQAKKIFTFSAINIKEEYGWVEILIETDGIKFSVKYSSVMTDSSDLFEFLAELIELKANIAIILDNEGSNPLLYAEKINNDIIRLIFASDYNLYKSFYNGKIDDYDLKDYKIEFDILIDKKYLLKEFYKILFPYVQNYKYNASDKYGYEFNVNKAKKCINKINIFLNKEIVYVRI